LALEPDNGRWYYLKGHQFRRQLEKTPSGVTRRKLATEATTWFREALGRGAGAVVGNIQVLIILARVTFAAGDHAQAETLALDLIPLPVREHDFGVSATAHHFGHTLLGLIALLQGKLDNATSHLLYSGDVKGSPQLNSTGPTMSLARELLRAGRRDAVITFLE